MDLGAGGHLATPTAPRLARPLLRSSSAGHAAGGLLRGLKPLPALGSQHAGVRRAALRPVAAAGAGAGAQPTVAAAAVPQEQQRGGFVGALAASVRDQFMKLDGLWDK